MQRLPNQCNNKANIGVYSKIDVPLFDDEIVSVKNDSLVIGDGVDT